MPTWNNTTKPTNTIEYILTEILDFLMTESDDFLITNQSSVFSNITKPTTSWTNPLK